MLSRRCRGVDPAQFVYFVGISKRTLARVDSLARSPRSLAPSPSRPLTACRSSAGVASNEQRASKQARKRESTGSPPSQPIQTFARSTWSKRERGRNLQDDEVDQPRRGRHQPPVEVLGYVVERDHAHVAKELWARVRATSEGKEQKNVQRGQSSL